MSNSSKIFTGLGVGTFIGLAAGLALAPDPAGAGYGMDASAVVSNSSAKSDLLVTSQPVAVKKTYLQTPVEVKQVQVIGGAQPSVVLIDKDGRIVYRSDPQMQRTTVARDAVIPGATAARVEAAFKTVSN